MYHVHWSYFKTSSTINKDIHWVTSLKAGVPRPQKSGSFSGGGGERVTHWVVDCQPRLVETVGNCKPTPPKHAHMCFLWWHSIQCVRHSGNSVVRTIHKSETLINFFLGPLWLLLLSECLHKDTSQSTSISRLPLPTLQPESTSSFLGQNRKPHSIYL